MTLSEIADYVCRKVDQTDTDSVDAARRFAAKRMKVVWDAALWPDTLVVYPDTAPVATRYVAPEPFERILEIRRANGTICKFYSPQAAFQTDPQLFDSTADPVGWVHDTSVALPLWGDALITSGRTDAGAIPDGGGGFVSNPLLNFKVIYLSNGGLTETVVYYGGGISVFAISPAVDAVRSVSVYNTDGTTPSFTAATFRANSTTITLTPERLQSQAYPVVRWLGKIQTSETILVMAKRRCRDLLVDGDCDLIPNTENAMLAFVQADMLQRDRQYAKANMLADEGNAMLKICTDLLNNQQATQQRIIPEYIGGDDWQNGNAFPFSSKTTW